MADILLHRDDDDVIRLGDDVRAQPMPPPRPQASNIGIELLFNRSKVSADAMSASGASDDEDEIPPDDGDLDDEDDFPADPTRGYAQPAPPPPPRQSTEEVNREKREVLYQLDRLASKGVKVPTFSVSDGLIEMKDALERIVRDREQEASVRFQRNALLAFVNGIEFLNGHYNPVDVHLDGWAETVNDKLTIGDYDDIFTELAEKYKMSGRKYAPELRLMFSLGGSAIMFHMSHVLVKNSSIPGLDEVLKSNPALMRQVASAAAKMGSKLGETPKADAAAGGGGLFSMLGPLMSGMNRPPPPPMQQQRPMQPPQQQQQNQNQHPSQTMRGPADMSEILRQLNRAPPAGAQDRMETLSVSDSDIGSILETTSEGRRRRTGAGGGGKPVRTMNLG